MTRGNRTAITPRFWLLFFSLSVLAMMTAAAQSPSFPGWSSRTLSGGTLYTPDNTPPGSVWLLLRPPQAAGNQQAALQQLIQIDATRRGNIIATGRPASAGHALSQTVEYGGTQGKYVILYVVIRTADGRLQTVILRTPPSGDLAMRSMHEAGRFLGQIASTAADQTPDQNSAQPRAASTAPSTVASPPQTGSVGGPASQTGNVAALIHTAVFRSTVTGGQVDETVYILFRDGTGYAPLNGPPDTFDAASARARNPKGWLHWRRQGSGYLVQSAGGQSTTLQPEDVVRLLPQGAALDLMVKHRTYYSFGIGAGSSGMTTYRFFPDGRFEQTGSTLHTGGASSAASYTDRNGQRSSAAAVGPNIVARSSSQNSAAGAGMAGTYRVTGYILELRHNNGRVERLLAFYPYAHDKPGTTAIYIGGTTYSTD